MPALYVAGARDPGLAMPGMRDMIAAQTALVPRLYDPNLLDGCGHWVPRDPSDEVNAVLLAFLDDVAR